MHAKIIPDIENITIQLLVEFASSWLKWKSYSIRHLAPVVQTLDSAIHWINDYPLDNSIGFASVYPLVSDLSAGQRYPSFEQLRPGLTIIKLPSAIGAGNNIFVI